MIVLFPTVVLRLIKSSYVFYLIRCLQFILFLDVFFLITHLILRSEILAISAVPFDFWENPSGHATLRPENTKILTLDFRRCKKVIFNKTITVSLTHSR